MRGGKQTKVNEISNTLIKNYQCNVKKDEWRYEIFESNKDVDYNTVVLNYNTKKSGKLLMILLM